MKPTTLIHAIVLSFGWRRWLIAFGAGALSALAMAPINAWPVLFLTFPALVWLIDGTGAGRWRGATGAAPIGWWFGFGYFLAGLYWVGYAFLVDAPTFGWLLPIAVIGLPAGLAIFTAFAVALARLLLSQALVVIILHRQTKLDIRPGLGRRRQGRDGGEDRQGDDAHGLVSLAISRDLNPIALTED